MRAKDSLRTIVVLGHSQGGALFRWRSMSNWNLAKDMGIMTQKDLRNIVDRTLVVIQLGATWLERAYGTEVVHRPGYRTALIEMAIVLKRSTDRTRRSFGSGLG